MKKSFLLLTGAAALAGASFGLVGCVGDGEVGVGVGVSGPAYYNDGPYFWGHPGYHNNTVVVEHGGGFRGGWSHGGGHPAAAAHGGGHPGDHH